MGRKTKERYEIEQRMSGALDDLKKSNTLINAKGRATLLAQKLFVLGLRCAKFSEEDNTMVSVLYGTHLKELFGVKSHSFYENIKALTLPDADKTTLTDWKIVYQDDEKKRLRVANVIQTVDFDNGKLIIKYNSDLSRYMGDLVANYTILPLDEILELNSMYSFRMYEILKSKMDYTRAVKNIRGAVVWEVNVTDFKLQVGIVDPGENREIVTAIQKDDGSYEKVEQAIKNPVYKEFNDLRKRVLDPSVKELNEKTRLQVSYKPIRQGRSVKILQFTIDNRDTQKEIVSTEKAAISDDEMLEIIAEARAVFDKDTFSITDLKKIVKQADYDMDKIKKAAACFYEATDVQNPTGYVISAIKEGYEPGKKNVKQSGFATFQQNQTDYSKIEDFIIEGV